MNFNLIFLNNCGRLIQYIPERHQRNQTWVDALVEAHRAIPVQFINGPFDPVSGKHMVLHWKQVFGEKNVVELPENIGHYPQLEDPDSVSKHYLHFIRSLDSNQNAR